MSFDGLFRNEITDWIIGWLHGEDDRCSRSYDFIETDLIWEKWWFRVGFIVVLVCLLWFFLSIL